MGGQICTLQAGTEISTSRRGYIRSRRIFRGGRYHWNPSSAVRHRREEAEKKGRVGRLGLQYEQLVDVAHALTVRLSQQRGVCLIEHEALDGLRAMSLDQLLLEHRLLCLFDRHQDTVTAELLVYVSTERFLGLWV